MNRINVIIVALMALTQICWCSPVEKYSDAHSAFDISGIRDPFLPPASFTKTNIQLESIMRNISGQMQIKGVVIDSNKKYVIINEEIIKEKDKWNNFTIDRIERNQIVIDYEGEKIHYPIVNEPEQTQKRVSPNQNESGGLK